MEHRDGFDMQIKLLTLGDAGVGKSSLMLRFVYDKFDPTIIATIGIAFNFKTIDVGGKRIKLQLWDTASQERYRTITKSYVRGAHGILLVFDVMDRKSFNSIRTWLEEIDGFTDKHMNKILIGCRCDLEDRAVKRAEAEALARDYGMQYFETSAKMGLGVEEAFRSAVESVVDSLSKEGSPVASAGAGGAAAHPGATPQIDLSSSTDEQEDGGCCK